MIGVPAAFPGFQLLWENWLKTSLLSQLKDGVFFHVFQRKPYLNVLQEYNNLFWCVQANVYHIMEVFGPHSEWNYFEDKTQFSAVSLVFVIQGKQNNYLFTKNFWSFYERNFQNLKNKKCTALIHFSAYKLWMLIPGRHFFILHE